MSRKDKATAACAAIMALTLALAIGLALLRRWQEAERARRQAQEQAEEAQLETAEIREKFDSLKQWIEELGLPIEDEAEKEPDPPAAEDEGNPPIPEEVKPTPDFSAAGLTYPSGYGPGVKDKWFPHGIEPVMEIYLGWQEHYPEGYARLIAWGRGEVPSHQLDPAMVEASRIAYDGYRWDTWIECRLGARASQSPYYGKGQECAYCLWKRGRTIENALATLEAESTYGLAGSLHFGILYGGYPNTLEGYCDLLDTWSTSIDPWEQACFWNMPGYPRYQQGFTKIAETMRGWRP